MRLVLDANTLASGAVSSTGAIAELLEAWLIEQRFTVVSSELILGEVEATLRKRYFARRLAPTDRGAFMDLVRRQALIVIPRAEHEHIAPDPDDDHVLGTAVDGEASYLVTGDRALLAVGEFRGVKIVTARELLQRSEPFAP